ncbi:MAG TPA: response regulator transcription factor [Cyclobacteriaceae bacterium]|nr:response regulator transcription factor [Cyclobacteriaceae bacterium]
MKVYIADDHTFVRKGMIRLLNTFKRLGELKEAADGKELIELVQISEPDAVILDLEMPRLNGFDTARHLLEHYPDVKILILTMHTEEVFILNLMELGVHGFLNKNAEPEEVEKALYSIMDKDFYRNDIVNQALRKGIKRTPQITTTSRLSAREMEVLMLICQELTPSEISARLKISEKTFFNHRTNILTKTAVRGNVGLVKYAYQHGMLELTPEKIL